MSQYKINLACGNVFVAGNDWINLDYIAIDKDVRRANLLTRLPFPEDYASLVYSSHFLEHIPRNQVHDFLAECLRVLKSGGVLRLVLPDMDNLCRTYLTHRDSGEHEKADFVVLEILDQCVRREAGGEMGQMYRRLTADSENNRDFIEFVRIRTGENILNKPSMPTKQIDVTGLVQRVWARAVRLWTRAVLSFLPEAFRLQNVSYTDLGECHHWVWDFYQLRKILETVGFVSIERSEASASRINGFPFKPLDLDDDGRPRKGNCSMYIEASKP